MVEYANVTQVPGGKEVQTLCFMTDKRFVRKNFVDLRLLVDDKTVLRNPHKGWFWHYIDNGYGRGAYREHHDPRRRPCRLSRPLPSLPAL